MYLIPGQFYIFRDWGLDFILLATGRYSWVEMHIRFPKSWRSSVSREITQSEEFINRTARFRKHASSLYVTLRYPGVREVLLSAVRTYEKTS